MKIKALLTALFITAIGVASSHAVVSTNAIIEKLYTFTSRVEAKDKQILFTQIDSIRHDQFSTQTYHLDEGTTYSVIIFGDDSRVTDMDCQVRDADDNVLGTDADETNLAVVTFTAEKTGPYTIVADAYEMVEGAEDSFFCIVIVRES